MKKNILIITILLSLTFLLSTVCFAYLIERADKVNVTVGVEVSLDTATGKYKYNYTVTNHADSIQDLNMLFIEYDGTNPEVYPPENWRIGLSHGDIIYEGETHIVENRTPNNKLYMSLSQDEELKPGSTQSGFIIETEGLPDIVTYYARGYVPLPEPNEEIKALIEQYIAEQNIEAIDALEKEDAARYEEPENPELENIFVNSAKGQTLGPIDPPEVFEALSFIDKIIAYKEESVELGWIDDPGVSDSLNQKLANAKKMIKSDRPSAKNLLQALLNELDAQKGQHVKDNAYYLLKYNVLYLMDRM